MAEIIAGLASSHAFALVDPSTWDVRRERNRSMYKKRYGVEPPLQPKLADETPEARDRRYRNVKSGLNFFRDWLKETRPDALILIGDDQNENFRDDNLPQIAIYLGEKVLAANPRVDGAESPPPQYRCHTELAHTLLEGLVERDFDIAFSKSFPKDQLLSHAHAPILRTVDPEASIPVVLLFVNAIHVPAISPRRCYSLGDAMRQILTEKRPAGERVAIYASGGLSHFTGGYPWRHYSGPFSYGSISEEFDRTALEWMSAGRGDKLAGLTSKDLLDNGDIEMRSWIVLAGAMGQRSARVLAYEPLYSGNMGMAVAFWGAGEAPAGQTVASR
jgi:aromatic ring-opening dioxygenase catalytic subunit (LigB family)